MLGPEQRVGSSTLPLPGAGAEERPEEVEWIESDVPPCSHHPRRSSCTPRSEMGTKDSKELLGLFPPHR